MKKVVIMESLGISQAELESFQKPFEERGITFVSYPKPPTPSSWCARLRTPTP